MDSGDRPSPSPVRLRVFWGDKFFFKTLLDVKLMKTQMMRNENFMKHGNHGNETILRFFGCGTHREKQNMRNMRIVVFFVVNICTHISQPAGFT